MSKYKFVSTFSHKMEAFVFILLQIYISMHMKNVFKQLTVHCVGCFLFSVLWFHFTNKKCFFSSVTTAKQFLLS